MTYEGFPWMTWRIHGPIPCWRVMIYEHVLRIYKTMQVFDPKIVAACHRANERQYKLKFTVEGSYPDRAVVGVESLEPQDLDYIPDL